MSKVIKNIGKAVKGIGKAVKKVVSSKVGKALLIAATIYIGGAALGAWQSPFQSINGALVGGAKASTGTELLAAGQGGTINTAGLSAPGAASASTTQQVAGGTLNLGSLGGGSGATTTASTSQVAGGTLNLGSLGAPAAQTATAAAPVAASATTAAPAAASSATPSAAIANAAESGAQAAKTVGELTGQAAGTEAPKGIISKIMSGVQPGLDFMTKNPVPTAMLLSAAGSAASPDEIDILKEQQRLQNEQEEKNIERRAKNMDLAGIRLNLTPTGRSLTNTSGAPVYGATGIINRSRGML